MLLRFWFLLLSSVFALSMVARADVSASLRLGDEALACGLWEVAAEHFQSASAQAEPVLRARVTWGLAEAWIRGGQPDKALELLQKTEIRDSGDALFWRAQALAAQGKFDEAVVLFGRCADADPPVHFVESLLSVSALRLSLGDPEQALAALERIQGEGEETAVARMREVDILLGMGRVEEAAARMPELSALPERESLRARYLQARVWLMQGKADEAASGFTELIEDAELAGSRIWQLAIVGQTDALHAAGRADEAVERLVSFISTSSQSAMLESAFQRLIRWLPENPAGNDPVLERVREWVPPVAGGVPAWWMGGSLSDSGAQAPGEAAPTMSERAVFAVYASALGLRAVETPEARREARALLLRLVVEAPEHFLAERALVRLARWDAEDGEPLRAEWVLRSLADGAKSPARRGNAEFHLGLLSEANGNPSLAARHFAKASRLLSAEDARFASYNAGLLGVWTVRNSASGSAKSVDPTPLPPGDPLASSLDLERILALKDAAEKAKSLREFIERHADHGRVAEARMALAESMLTLAQPDVAGAAKVLEWFSEDAARAASVSPARFDWARLRIADLRGDAAAAVELARKLMDARPNDRAIGQAAFILGKNLYQTKNYNDARLVLEKLAAAGSSPEFTQAAWLLAARSASQVPTGSSHQEALTLYDKATEAEGDLGDFARLEKARLLIDDHHLEGAISLLGPWFEKLSVDAPLRVPVGLLLAEAWYASGSGSPDSLKRALQVHDALLKDRPRYSALYNQLQYLRGKALEQLPEAPGEAESPASRALKAYYSVLETDEPPAEWKYFEDCGFGALDILIRQERWQAAVECARKIASFKGPRASEAARRAEDLRLKHMIWED